MKKLSLILAISISSLFANANVKTPNVISNEIQEGIKIEKQFLNQNQKVEILFTTNQNGDVNFALAKTNNTNLKLELEKQFSLLNFKALKSETVYSIVLNIKII